MLDIYVFVYTFIETARNVYFGLLISLVVVCIIICGILALRYFCNKYRNYFYNKPRNPNQEEHILDEHIQNDLGKYGSTQDGGENRPSMSSQPLTDSPT